VEWKDSRGLLLKGAKPAELPVVQASKVELQMTACGPSLRTFERASVISSAYEYAA
jgi:hypothetical protein